MPKNNMKSSQIPDSFTEISVLQQMLTEVKDR